MASIGRLMAVAPQVAKPAAAPVPLRRPRVFICRSNSHPIVGSVTQGENVLVDCARFKGSLEIAGDCRQEAKVTSWKNAGERATELSSMMMAFAATTLVAATCINVAEANSLESLEVEVGAVFERTCAGCHSGGGNILQPAATLRKEDLQKNGRVAVDDIYNITYFGKNRMPGYGEKCTPRGQCTFGPRLSEENIRALAEFVKLNADQGWSK